MPKIFKITAATLTIIVLAAVLYNYFAFADERKVQRALLDLREKISAPAAGGLDTVLSAASLNLLFTPEVTIFIQRADGGELRRTFGRDELTRVIIGMKQSNPELAVKLDFSRRNIKIVEGRSATAPALATVENLSEPFEQRRLTFTFEKNEEARWRLASVQSDN